MISQLTGTYSGTGTWHEESGDSGSYTVVLTIEETPDGFRVDFRHVFDNGDPDVEASFGMKWSTAPLFILESGGSAIGRGYVLDGLCHYTANLSGMLLEASYLQTENGLKVWGSSSQNKAGHPIAWVETLLS